MRRKLSRISGISWLGIQWQPRPAKADVAQKVISFLEDKRVLYNPYDLEVADYCIHSVIEIREYLTHILADLPNQEGLSQHIRAIRAACRKFLDEVELENGHRSKHPINMFSGGPEVWKFTTALGELRGAIGLHVAIIANKYSLGVEGDLARILPASDEEEVLPD